MSFTNTVILQIIIFYCLVIALRKTPTVKSLRLGAFGVAVVSGWCWYGLPKYALGIGLGLYLPLVLLPMLLLRHLTSLLATAQFESAARWARGVRWLVPTDGMWVYPQILQGLAFWQQGKNTMATKIFHRHQADPRMMPRSAIALSYRLANSWAEYLAWADRQFSPSQLERDRSPIKTYYLRAIGETGDLPRLLAWLDRSTTDPDLRLVQLQTLALCGRTTAVAQLAPQVLSAWPLSVSEFWLGTAELAAGQSPERLRQLTNTTDAYVEQDVKWRLTQALPNLRQLSREDWEVVDRIAAAALQDTDHSQLTSGATAIPATNFLIWLNIGIFGAEFVWKILGQPAPLPWVVEGGVIAPLVMTGEWWRLISANFLHVNFIHLLMNMLGLNYLGKFVEQQLGTVRFLVAYALTGLGAMACVTYVDLWRATTPPSVTAGASGAIMGLLGVMGAIYLVSWWQHQTPRASRELKSIGIAVGLQLIFDLTNGHTSIVGHFSGLAIGLVVGLGLASIKIK
jgi:rhomboid protease GluP